jgi:hypothetical protein
MFGLLQSCLLNKKLPDVKPRTLARKCKVLSCSSTQTAMEMQAWKAEETVKGGCKEELVTLKSRPPTTCMPRAHIPAD